MKWIGQHIYDQISRFRNNVFLEDVSTGTIASGGNLGLDSNNKIVKATSTSHDEVTLAGTPDYITISGQEITRNAVDLAADVTGTLPLANGGTGQTSAQAAINALAGGTTSGRFLRGNGSNVIMAAIQSADVGTLNQDTTGSAATLTTPRAINGVDFDGSAPVTVTAAAGTLSGTELKSTVVTSSITAVGTIATGTWQGTAIAHAYIGANAIETDNIADAQVTVAKLHADAIQTSGESFADNDTSLMTSAAIDDKINTKYSTSYITFSVKSSSTYGTNYILMHANGISGGLVNKDSGVDSATDFGGVTAEEAGGSTQTCSVPSADLEQQIPIPETCKLIGFYATTTTNTNTGAAYDQGVGIWHVPESNVDWGGSTASTATLIHKSDSSRHTEGSNRKKVQKVERMDGTAKTLGAGDILIPSVFGETSNQQIMATITLVIATPIKTIA